MKELKQMLWMVLGVLGGFMVGGLLLLLIIQATGNAIPRNSTLALFVSVPILGGGLVGGGYLAQWLVHKYDKGKRKKLQAEKGKTGMNVTKGKTAKKK